MFAQVEKRRDRMNDKPNIRTYFLGSIASSVCDVLEELGLDAENASKLVECEANESWRTAVYVGFDSYLRILKLNGGIPKPPSV